MSLLEDVFLQDEADEAQELERIIEGDENYDERPPQERNSEEDSEKEDEAIEDKRRVDPTSKTKRVVKNPRFTLNPARLTGPRGIQVLPDHFKDFKFKGKGHEKEDLDMVLKKLEHWAYRLYPKFTFEDCLKKIETLGKKRPVMVHLHKIRSDQLITEETVVQKDSSDEESPPAQEEDEFDKLLQQQIELARGTPGPGSRTPGVTSTPIVDKRSLMPKATSSPSISDEQKERMLRNRKLAEERRLARFKNQTSNQNATLVDLTSNNLANIAEDDDNTEITPLKTLNETAKNRFNVIDGSDDDSDSVQVNQAIVADIHIVDDANVIDITEGYQRQSEVLNDGVVDLINEDTEVIMTKNKELQLRDENMDSMDTHNDAIVDEKILRKNRSNVIDSSDDDNDSVEDNQADIHKVNDANVIDITEGYQRQSEILNDGVVDLINEDTEHVQTKSYNMNTNYAKIANKTMSKKNRSNVIDSSDDDCDSLQVNKAVTSTRTNVHKDNDEKVIDIIEGNQRQNKIINNEVVDLMNEYTEEIMSTKKCSKTNVIDSSDDDDVTAVNQDITVDIHDNRSVSRVNYHDNDIRDKTQASEKIAMDVISDDEGCNVDNDIDNKSDDVQLQNAEDSNKTMICIDDGERSNETKLKEDKSRISDKEVASKLITAKSDLIIRETVTNNEDNNVKPKTNDSVKTNKENIDSNVNAETALDDLMDVDFNDDF